MAIQRLGLAFELFPDQRLPRYAGGTSDFSAPMANYGVTRVSSSKLSTLPISTNSLSAAFSAKCSLTPASNVSGPVRHFRLGSPIASSIPTVDSQAGTGYRTYHGHFSVGERNFGRSLHITSYPSLEGGKCSSSVYSFAIPVSRYKFHERRLRSVIYRILKLSTPFKYSWSVNKRRYVNLRVSRESTSGIHYVLMYNRRLSTLRKYYVMTSSPGFSVEFNHMIANKLYRGLRGFRASSHFIRYLSTTRSLRSQGEGHGIPEKVMLAEEEKLNEEDMSSPGGREADFLTAGYGWRVRDAALNDLQELVRVTDIQTDAFHIPAAAFDDLFYKLFHAEVLSSLQYKARHSPPDRYSCLLAEKDPSQPGYVGDFLSDENMQTIVGAVDVTALMDSNIVSLLPGAYEYLYISGMAVDAAYRRRGVATLLLAACVARASEWGFKYLVLHAYEDDMGARSLYSGAGFRTVSGDPVWISKFLGRRRRVVMARRTAPLPDELQG